MIKIQNLEKSYGKTVVLKNINLEINDGDIYGLVGASGAGKSTLLRCINGLEKYNSGSIEVQGTEVSELTPKNLSAFRKNIGMIFQNFSLLERRSVYENIDLPMVCWKYDKEYREKRIDELLELVGLTDKKHAMPKELSGGQKQRVAIARALAMKPEILLCDEATAALDPNITKSILRLLNKINEELGITIVVVTHQMEVVKAVCNKIAILEDGVLKENGRVDDIFLSESEALYNLTGDDNSYICSVSGKTIKVVSRSGAENQSLIYDMANQDGIKFKILASDSDFYRDSFISTYTLSIDDQYYDNVIEYLNKNNIEYRVMKCLQSD